MSDGAEVVKEDANDNIGVDEIDPVGTAINLLAANIAACILETLFLRLFSCKKLEVT